MDGNTLETRAKELKEITKDYGDVRETSRRYYIEPGLYCLIPCTVDPGQEADYIMRIATEMPAEKGYEIDHCHIRCNRSIKISQV